MASSLTPSWGCCTNKSMVGNDKFINCVQCNKPYHFLCLSITEISKESKEYNVWKCPECLSQMPKVSKKDCTPIRNVTTSRGNKRPALNSPTKITAVTSDEVRSIVQEVVHKELDTMAQQFTNMIVTIINRELEPIINEMKDLKESLNFHTAEFDRFQSEHVELKGNFKHLQEENNSFKKTVCDLSQRLNYLEQQARSSNLEIQCLPENKQENLFSVAKQLGSVVGCGIKDGDIMNCTRIAKLQTSSDRPRSIVVQLASPRIRDQLLASVINYNKKTPECKLSSADFGLAGNKTPVYVVEHLSPAHKALHAATRLKAKEKGYKFVWVRNGRIFVRKNVDSDHILIKTIETVNKLV